MGSYISIFRFFGPARPRRHPFCRSLMGTAHKCPNCSSKETTWKGYRKLKDGKARLRKCKKCGRKSTSRQKIECDSGKASNRIDIQRAAQDDRSFRVLMGEKEAERDGGLMRPRPSISGSSLAKKGFDLSDFVW